MMIKSCLLSWNHYILVAGCLPMGFPMGFGCRTVFGFFFCLRFWIFYFFLLSFPVPFAFHGISWLDHAGWALSPGTETPRCSCRSHSPLSATWSRASTDNGCPHTPAVGMVHLWFIHGSSMVHLRLISSGIIKHGNLMIILKSPHKWRYSWENQLSMVDVPWCLSTTRQVGTKCHMACVGKCVIYHDIHPKMVIFIGQMMENENTLWWTYKKLWKITMFNGKIHYKWPFSIAMSVITRG